MDLGYLKKIFALNIAMKFGNVERKLILSVLGIVFGILLLSCSSSRQSVRLILQERNVIMSWNPNTEMDIDKYRIYTCVWDSSYKQPDGYWSCGNYIGEVQHPQTAFIITNFDTSKWYGVTAVDTAGNESTYSELINKVSTSDTLQFPADINRDRIIDFYDLFELLDYWGITY